MTTPLTLKIQERVGSISIEYSIEIQDGAIQYQNIEQLFSLLKKVRDNHSTDVGNMVKGDALNTP